MTLPTLYIPHGGGPWPWVPSFGPGHAELRSYLEALPGTLPKARAILCISAHWEAPRPTLTAAAGPGLLYDYYGFPQNTYDLPWRASGDTELATRIGALLEAAGIETDLDPVRGLDHGTFVPLAVAWPKLDIPVVQLSLIRGLDPAQHLALGRALAPLRDEGVLIVGSGMSYHNMQGFGTAAGRSEAAAFADWLAESVSSPGVRAQRLTRWMDAPGGRASHPREEHLLPLMVVAGAAGSDPGRVTLRGDVLGKPVVATQFGS